MAMLCAFPDTQLMATFVTDILWDSVLPLAGTMTSADFLQFVVTAASRIQSFTVCKTSPGTHTFLLPVRLPHLLTAILYSYRA